MKGHRNINEMLLKSPVLTQRDGCCDGEGNLVLPTSAAGEHPKACPTLPQANDVRLGSKERRAVPPDAWQGVPAIEANCPVKGSWSTKVTALIKYLKYLAAHEDRPQSLVYTQWSYVRDTIAQALEDNEISYAHIARSATELDRFKSDATVQVSA